MKENFSPHCLVPSCHACHCLLLLRILPCKASSCHSVNHNNGHLFTNIILIEAQKLHLISVIVLSYITRDIINTISYFNKSLFYLSRSLDTGPNLYCKLGHWSSQPYTHHDLTHIPLHLKAS